MALDLELRHVKERVFTLLAGAVSPWASPTQLTLIGFVFGLACCWACALGELGWATALWWINRFFDGLDGVVARYSKRQTDLGGYVDIVCDFTVYALLPICLVHAVHDPVRQPHLWLVVALMEGTFFVNAGSLLLLSAILERRAATRARKEHTTVALPRSLIEGFETMVFFQLFLLLPDHLTQLMGVFALAVAATVVWRMVGAVNLLR